MKTKAKISVLQTLEKNISPECTARPTQGLGKPHANDYPNAEAS